MNFDNLEITYNDEIATLKITREKALNALNRKTLEELNKAVNELNDNDKIKAVIITGKGKAFVAGADIAEMKNMNVPQAKSFSLLGHEIFNKIENSEKIYIAAVNGYALGGGCELALACDIRIASECAKFGQPEIKLGIIPGFGGTQRLSKMLGKAKALELILSGDNISAKKAYKLKLINNFVEHNDLINKAELMAEKIASKSAPIISLAKESVNSAFEKPIAEGSKLEANLFSICFSTKDQKEGMTAFIENRKANFEDK